MTVVLIIVIDASGTSSSRQCLAVVFFADTNLHHRPDGQMNNITVNESGTLYDVSVHFITFTTVLLSIAVAG